MNKKIKACSKEDYVITQKDKNNFVLELSTAAFEVARRAVFDCLHFSTGTEATKNARHIEYVKEEDPTGVVMSETLKVKNWQMFKKMKKVSLNGECKVSINIYRTTSKMLFNGKDAKQVIDLLAPAIEAYVKKSENEIKEMNERIKRNPSIMPLALNIKKQRKLQGQERKIQMTRSIPLVARRQAKKKISIKQW